MISSFDHSEAAKRSALPELCEGGAGRFIAVDEAPQRLEREIDGAAERSDLHLDVTVELARGEDTQHMHLGN